MTRLNSLIPLLDFLFAQVVIYRFASHLSKLRIHGDESLYIGSSYYFEALIYGPTANNQWDQSYWLMTTTLLPRYIIGLGRLIAGYGINQLNTLTWNFNAADTVNMLSSAMPSNGLLWVARFPMVLLTIASILIVYRLLHQSSGRFAAYTWVILCVTSEYYLTHLRRAMTEAPLLFFMVVTMLLMCALLQLIQHYDPIQTISWQWKLIACLTGLGISIGLMAASKLNGFGALAATIPIIYISIYRLPIGTRAKVKFITLAMLAVGVIAFGTFVLLHPHTWPTPIQIIWKMLEQRIKETSEQMREWPQAVINNSNRVPLLAKRISYNYASIRIEGQVALTIMLNIGFFVTGFIITLKRMWSDLENQKSSNADRVFFAMGAAMSIPSLFTPLDWDRYYLIPVFFATIFIAIGLGFIIHNLLKLLSDAISKYHIPLPNLSPRKRDK